MGTSKGRVSASDGWLGVDSTRLSSRGDSSSGPGSAVASLQGSRSVTFPMTTEEAAAVAATTTATSLPSGAQAGEAGSGRPSPILALPGDASGSPDGSRPSSVAASVTLWTNDNSLSGAPTSPRDARFRSGFLPAGRLRPSSASMSVLDVALMPMRGVRSRSSSVSGNEDLALQNSQVCDVAFQSWGWSENGCRLNLLLPMSAQMRTDQ